MAVQQEDRYSLQGQGTVLCFVLIFVLCCSVLFVPHGVTCAPLRQELQQSYELYKKSELHYKVFALKHEDNQWDGWYTWGYNDLDQAILDAVAECNKGRNVLGKCQVYGLGNEVVVGLEPTQLQGKIEEYRISGMVNRSYPKPGGGKLIGLGLSGDGHYFAGVLREGRGARLFIYDTGDELWKHTFVLKTDLTMETGRTFSLGADGTTYAYARYSQSSSGNKGKSTLIVKGWDEKITAEIPLNNGAFWNGGCGLALSPSQQEVAVCIDDGVSTKVVRYDIFSGQKRGEIKSSMVKGTFDRSMEYSPDGKFFLIHGGRYQFDWVLKKKGQEAALSWLFSVETGRLIQQLEFPLGPGKKGPTDIHFSTVGHDIIIATNRDITVYAEGDKMVFPRESGPMVKVLLNPYGVLAVADGVELSRYNIVDGHLVPIALETVASHQYMLGFDRKREQLVVVGGQTIEQFSAFRQIDIQAMALYQRARGLFEHGKYKKGFGLLSEIVKDNPRLPSGFSAYNFYLKYPDVALASFGRLYGAHVDKILEQSPKVSRLGFNYVKDTKSGLFFTTIQGIGPNTSAARSALASGDRVTHVNGVAVVLATQISEVLAPLPPSTRVVLNYMRDGRIKKASVVTEVGFADSGRAAHVLLTLFDYGQLAAEAGHPGLTRFAAARLREISGRYPSSFRTDLVEQLAVSLEGLAFSVEGDMEAAFDLLEASAPHPFMFRLYNTRVWGEFYKDRRRLAQVLGVAETKLPQFDGVLQRQNQDYPDLHGVLIPALVTPSLLR